MHACVVTDRGTHQAVGIVTDCEYLLTELSRQLNADPAAPRSPAGE